MGSLNSMNTWMVLVYKNVLFFEMGLCICRTQPCENKFASNYIDIRVASICSKKRLLSSYVTCVLSQCMRLCMFAPFWPLAEKLKSVHARFSSKQTHNFLHGDVPLHEHTRSCKVSADIGPTTHTGCSESFPFCHLHSNGDGIWGFATCNVFQIWVWRDARRLCCFSAASEGVIWPTVHLDL